MPFAAFTSLLATFYMLFLPFNQFCEFTYLCFGKYYSMAQYYFPCEQGASCYGNKMSIAVVSTNGDKKVKSCPTKNKIIFWNFPFIRGLQYFVFGLFALFNTFMQSFNMTKEDNKKSAKKWLNVIILILIMIVCFLISFLALGFMPGKLSFVVVHFSNNRHLRGLFIGLIKIAVIFFILLLMRVIPFMQDFYRFNGACNQISNNAGKSDKIIKLNHHYPLNLLNFIIFSFILSIFMVSLIAVNVNAFVNPIINFAIFFGIVMISYELLLLMCKGKYIVRCACLITSWFLCVKPSVTQEEIVRVAQMEDGLGFSKKTQSVISDGSIALSAVLTEMQTKLSQAHKYEKSDVEWIIATVLNKNRSEMKLVSDISAREHREITKATERRAKGEPLSSIFGFVDFYGLRIDINKKVLSPRMETELLVEEALKIIGEKKNPDVCDMCTGSGAIAIAIEKNSNAKVIAVDISPQALAVAKANAQKHNAKIEFIESDLFMGLKKNRKFDIIVSNPPYVTLDEYNKLDDEVKKYDPKIALLGGKDGLDFYRSIAESLKKHLAKNGVLLLEIGDKQANDVKQILKDKGLENVKVIKDYNGKERIIYGRFK